MVDDSAEDSGAVERDNGYSDKVGSEQRNDNPERESREQVLAHAEEKGHREKYDDGNQGYGEHRQADFVGAALGGHGRGLTQFNMAKNIFQHDDGVVDQAGKGQSQSTEHHTVDGLVAGVQKKERGHYRQRNGKEDGRGRSRAAQENQDHQGGEAKTDSALAKHGGDGLFDK